MKMLIILMLFLCSCVNSPKVNISFAELDLKLTQEWIYAEAVDDIRSNGEIILRPPGFEQLVTSLVIPNLGGLSSKRHCLYYQVPYKEKTGRLRVQEVKSEESCPDGSNDKNNYITFGGINNFRVTFANFKISLEFDYQKEKKTITIPLTNVELGLVHEKYHALQEKKLKSGLKFLRLSDESFDNGHNKYLGKLSDRFSRGSAIRCQKIDKNCQTIGENRCDNCKYGWYEVVDFQCPQGGSKFCGQNHCGEKNEPACPRGIKVIGEAEAGICQNDLEPIANADKILICQ